MFLIIGSVVVLLSVGVGFIMGGGSLLLLWHPTEVLIICGAAFGAFVISNPPKVVKASLAGIMALLKPAKYGRADYVDIFKLLYDILVKARKEGMLPSNPTSMTRTPAVCSPSTRASSPTTT